MEGGGRIIAWLARFVQDNTVCSFQRGAVVAVGEKMGEKVEDEGRSHFLDPFSNRIRGLIRSGG